MLHKSIFKNLNVKKHQIKPIIWKIEKMFFSAKLCNLFNNTLWCRISYANQYYEIEDACQSSSDASFKI